MTAVMKQLIGQPFVSLRQRFNEFLRSDCYFACLGQLRSWIAARLSTDTNLQDDIFNRCGSCSVRPVLHGRGEDWGFFVSTRSLIKYSWLFLLCKVLHTYANTAECF